jgi:hypothetical protein
LQSGLGIAALVVGIIALIFGFVPCVGGIVAYPAGGVGLILGIVGLIVALCRNKQGVGFPIAGSAVSAAALLVTTLWVIVVAGIAKRAEPALKKFDEELKKVAKEAQAETKKSTARVHADRIGQACDVYKLKNGQYPPNLEALTQVDAQGDGPYLADPKTIIDPWGNPYQYDPAGPHHNGQKADVWAVGPDGQMYGNW